MTTFKSSLSGLKVSQEAIFTDITSVTYAELNALIVISALKPKQKYSISNSYHGGSVIVTAITGSTLEVNAIWLRNTKLCAFGIIGLIAGSSGSVNTLTVNGINIMTAAVNYTTSLSNTATLIANNINANGGSAYSAIAINEYIVITTKVASATNNGEVIAMTTTTLTASTSLPLKNGVNPVAYTLAVQYDITKDRFNSCVDPIWNNTLNVNLNATNTVDVYNDFRWGDPVYYNNVISSSSHYYNFVYNNATDLRRGYYSDNSFTNGAYMQRNFISGSPAQTSTQSFGYSGLRYVTAIGGYMYGNIFISANNQAILYRINLFGTGGIFQNTIHCMQVFTNGFVFLQSLTMGNAGVIYNCKSLGQGAYNFQSCYIDGTVTISCIALSLVTMYQCSIGISSVVTGVVNITSSFRLYRINIIGRTDNINSITAGITNFVVNNSTTPCGFYDIQIIGGASVLPNIVLNSNGATIQRIALVGSNLIWGNFTTTDDFNIISDYTLTNDEYSFAYTTPTLDGTANKGLVDSPIQVGLVPAKWYCYSADFEATNLTGTGATLKLGIDTDGDGVIIPATAIATLNGVITTSVPIKTKATVLRKITITPQSATVLTGSVRVIIKGRIGL